MLQRKLAPLLLGIRRCLAQKEWIWTFGWGSRSGGTLEATTGWIVVAVLCVSVPLVGTRLNFTRKSHAEGTAGRPDPPDRIKWTFGSNLLPNVAKNGDNTTLERRIAVELTNAWTAMTGRPAIVLNDGTRGDVLLAREDGDFLVVQLKTTKTIAKNAYCFYR